MIPLSLIIILSLSAASTSESISPATVTPDSVYEYTLSLARSLINDLPDYGPAWFTLGVVEQFASKYESAITAYQKGLELSPDDPDSLKAVADLYGKLNQYDEAVEWYKKTATVHPTLPSIHLSLARALLQLGQREEARHALEEELQQRPSDYSAHYYLAQVLF